MLWGGIALRVPPSQGVLDCLPLGPSGVTQKISKDMCTWSASVDSSRADTVYSRRTVPADLLIVIC